MDWFRILMPRPANYFGRQLRPSYISTVPAGYSTVGVLVVQGDDVWPRLGNWKHYNHEGQELNWQQCVCY
ncbi:MAG: hypothetical protein U0930_18150 [Pirellulales bacterium]